MSKHGFWHNITNYYVFFVLKVKKIFFTQEHQNSTCLYILFMCRKIGHLNKMHETK